MSEWQRGRLDEAAEVVMGSSPPGDTYNSHGDGLPFIQGSAEFGTHFPTPVKWCSAPLKVAEAGDLMVSVRAPVGDTNFANERIAIGRGLALVRGGALTTSEFLRLVLQFASADLLARSGSGMFTSITAKELKGFEVPLPPLTEQRRIVDVMAAVDAQIGALEAEEAAGRGSIGPLSESLLADEEWSATALGEVGQFIRGKRFTKADYTTAGLGVIHYSHIHTHFGPVTTEVVAHVSEAERSRLRLASTGDVVIAATSEDLEGVGKATVWLGADDVAVHDDAQIFRHQLDPRFASFVFASPAFQAQKVRYAGGTKVTRISGADLARIAVPIPPLDVQRRIGEGLGEVVAHADRIAAELDRLRMFRSALLSSLLNQEIEVPESYDQLLEGVA